MEILNWPVAHLLGWALFHSLWIGALVAVALALSLNVLAGRPAVVRYGIACGALVVLATAPLQITGHLRESWAGHQHYVWMIENGVRHQAGVGHVPDPEAAVSPTAAAIRAEHDASMTPWLAGVAAVRIGQVLAFLALVWVGGVVVHTNRARRDWRAVRRLRRDIEPAPESWSTLLSDLVGQMKVSVPVTLARSRHVEVPSLVGWRRPVVLLPTWLRDDRPLSEIEAILAHELAHVRRHDFLINAVQSVTDVVFFYHPAYWWIVTKIKEEREFCCDDIATSSVPGGVRVYLESLMSLEGHRPSGVSQALALTDGDLVKRARRLAGSRSSTRPGLNGAVDAAAFVLAIVLLCLPLNAVPPAVRYASGAMMKQDLEIAVIREEAQGLERQVESGPDRPPPPDRAERR